MASTLLDFKGKKALIVGVANERSLAWGVAQELHRCGCELGFTYLGDALEKRVRPLAESVGATLIEPLDAGDESQIAALFKTVEKKWGKLDSLIHSIAYADKKDLEGRFINTSREGFLKAMDISAYTLVSLARAAEPFMEKAGGGAIVTMSYLGSERVVKDYNVMGVAKAALEASVRYLAADMGPKKIRVNAISAGPIKTLAASGIRDFRSKLHVAEERSPLRENIDIDDVGAFTAFLCGPGGARITGGVHIVDGGISIVAI